MRVILTKISDERHALEVVRDDGSRDHVELESKSTLTHDFLHYAVESEAGIEDGFWGALAAGKTFTQMNDRTGAGMQEYAGTMGIIEMCVGGLSHIMKGVELEDIIAGIRRWLEAQGKADEIPEWLTVEFLTRVQERMRQLMGHWNATAFGATMEIEWLCV